MPMLPVWSSRFHAQTLTVDTDAYTANDVVGGLLTFTGAAKNVQNEKTSGYVADVFLVDEDNEGAAFTLWLFHEQPSTIADDAAFAPTADDLKKLFAVVTIGTGDYTDINSMKWAHVADLVHEFPPGDGNLYGYLVCTGTPTYAAADSLTIKLNVFTR